MTQKNCLNCGAPYDINENKCPYCGTSYYDLSALDLSNNEPCYLKIKINPKKQKKYYLAAIEQQGNYVQD